MDPEGGYGEWGRDGLAHRKMGLGFLAWVWSAAGVAWPARARGQPWGFALGLPG